MGKLFSAIERRIIETTREVCEKALTSSAYEIQQDIKNKICYKIVDDYYEEYTPTRYSRINSLYDAWEFNTELTNQRLHFYPTLDSDNLPDHYSRSKFHQYGDKWISRYDDNFDFESDDNGAVQNDWILKNFFDGIHPRFISREGLIFDESYQYDGVLKKMGKYVQSYKNSGRMIKILAKHLKQQCAMYK